MTINLSVPRNNDTPDLKPRITVIGVGGAGGNAVNNMIESHLEGVEFVVANTDAQALAQSRTDRRIQLGTNVTQGLGAGSRPEIGRAAADESIEEVMDQLRGINMVFIAAGMGGGTGTGGAPVIARAAREQGILTVGVVTKPFHFEGNHRMTVAEAGIEELGQFVDTLLIIPNQNLFRVANEKTTFADAFSMADEVLHSGVRGVTDLMVMPGLINLDFADIRTVMSEMGKAMMGTGEAEGERRALDAAEAAIANPLLDDSSMKGARGVLINVVGGSDMTLFEVDEAANRIRAEVDADAYINFGAIFDPDMDGKMRVSVVATGIDSDVGQMPRPTMLDMDRPAYAPQPAPEPEPLSATVVAMHPAPVSRDSAVPRPQAAETAASETAVEVEAAATSEPEPMQAEAGTRARKVEPVLRTGKAEPEMPAPAAKVDADPFIPPAPMGRLFGGISAKVPDPFAAAAMSNGAARPGTESPAPQVKAPSLFERVTGTGRAAKPAPQAMQPGLAPAQPALGSLESSGGAAGPQPEEDLLDIPAFLRRQAN